MIVYQDRRSPRPTAFRTPACLAGALNICRRQADTGDLLCLGHDFELDTPPESAPYIDLPDDWRTYLVGAFEPREHLRVGAGALDLFPIADSLGRAWHTPAVLAPGIEPREGTPVLALPWGADANGLPVRKATPAQAALIAAARAARAEILADTLKNVPIAITGAWVLPLFEAAYHLDRAQLLGWQLLDDQLVIGALMASAGFLKPREA